jgi:WhiB family redox-sensing transcriptional regulator
MNLHWTETASCVSADADLFFPLGDETVHAEQIAEIRRVCAACPAARRCLEWALTTGEPEGIWAGTTPGERRRIRAAGRTVSAPPGSG